MVYDYYRAHGRHAMPWRHRITPYRILVSEIMLQQTQVDRVTRTFGVFMERFPTMRSLAEAPVREVLAAWQGLGYNRRALMLQRTCQRMMAEYRGRLPSDPAVLRTFPGIGPATAASIAAFAFDAPVVFIETNIRTVFIHAFFRKEETVNDEEILPLVDQTLDGKSPRAWYYALMDYGTMLKKTNPNPNRRSVHYVRQSRFHGSDRQLRGLLLRFFLNHDVAGEEQVRESVSCDSARLHKILAGLVKDGFVSRTKGGYRVSS